jgi:hypothetical protein
MVFRIFLALLFCSFSLHSIAQKEEKAVKSVINKFFEGMEKGDTALLKSTCTANPVFQTYMSDKEGNLRVVNQDFADFIAFIGTPTDNKYDERIKFKELMVEQSLASVWTPYQFYLNGKFSHCGTNSFQLVKTKEGWKIQYIIDTRRKKCE